jgi:hypothetical protein
MSALRELSNKTAQCREWLGAKQVTLPRKRSVMGHAETVGFAVSDQKWSSLESMFQSDRQVSPGSEADANRRSKHSDQGPKSFMY